MFRRPILSLLLSVVLVSSLNCIAYASSTITTISEEELLDKYTYPILDSSKHIKCTLFDYISDIDGMYGNDTTGKAGNQSGINIGHTLSFPTRDNEWWNDWSSGTYSRQGIVEPLLQDGYPVLSSSIPNSESLKYLFDDTESEYKRVFHPSNTWFTYSDNNYFYDSRLRFTEFVIDDWDARTGHFVKYNAPAVVDLSYGVGQFFPFSSRYDAFYYDGQNFYLDEKGVLIPNGALCCNNPSWTNVYTNHYFGLRLDIDFSFQNDGCIKNKYGADEDMVFEFTGDDDVWVFIDDVLVLDMGGIHDTVSGSINFRTGSVQVTPNILNSEISVPYQYTSGYLNQLYQLALGEDYNEENFNGTTFVNGTQHKMSIFYLERGNNASNFKSTFNIQNSQLGNILLTKRDKVTNRGLSGAIYSLYTDSSCTTELLSGITTNSGFLGNLNLGKLDTGTYYLKEISTIEGYELDTQVYTLIVEDIDGGYSLYDESANKVDILYNEPVKPKVANLTIRKIDKDSQQALYDALFTLYSNAECSVDSKVGFSTVTDERLYLIEGLDFGKSYYLRETVAPYGYEEVDTTWEIIVDENGNVSSPDLENQDGNLVIENIPLSFIMPNTGGIGVVFVYIIGFTIILIVITILILDKKKNEKGN